MRVPVEFPGSTQLLQAHAANDQQARVTGCPKEPRKRSRNICISAIHQERCTFETGEVVILVLNVPRIVVSEFQFFAMTQILNGLFRPH